MGTFIPILWQFWVMQAVQIRTLLIPTELGEKVTL
jgi:hypothetical protein